MANVVWNGTELNELLAGKDGPVAKLLLQQAIKVETAAKRLAPVDTGRLRSSITHQLGSDGEGLYAQVGSDVEYAIFQELGTRYMDAHPYLRPAAAQVLGFDVGVE